MDHILLGEDAASTGKVHAQPAKEYKVVINLGPLGVIKGHITASNDLSMETLLEAAKTHSPPSVAVRSMETGAMVEVALSQIKAMFIVKSFRGNAKRKALRFYTNGPAVGGIWAEIEFKDSETIEGIVENSAQHLMGDGFVLHPSDSGSNNLVVYVNKVAIANYRVLGVRTLRESN